MINVMCVDDAPLVLDQTVSLCGEIDGIAEAKGFTNCGAALEYIGKNTVDIAVLDINMPDMNGIELAVRIKDKSPDTSIIFLTAYSEYAVEAFRLHASGYIMKPIDKETLAAEIKYALVNHPLYMYSRITVQTFGDFEVRVDGEILVFIKSKSKELLAYLIEKHGRSVSRLQAFMALYENREYDRSMQKQFDNVIRNLRNVLKEHGAEDIFVLERATMRIRPELIDCDMYRFLAGDADAVNSYRGEYMNQYSWANMREAYASRMKSDSR
ncbi:MAG: response regulator [Ruminiclostridium sp.]|nr:response regulator [Ruminiclostridium sp.]